MCEDDEDDFVVIKDAYPDDRRRFQEGALLKLIHEAGIFPGVVRVLEWGDVEGCDGSIITTARPASRKVARRTKKRLVMGSRGSRLSSAKSVKELLMAVFDGVEGNGLSKSHIASLLMISFCSPPRPG